MSSPYRSSNLFSLSLCPGKARAEMFLPDETTPWAEEGTLLHAHMADRSASRDELSPQQLDLLDVAEGLEVRWHLAMFEEFGITAETPKEIIKEREFTLLVDGKPWTDPEFDEQSTGHPDLVIYYPKFSSPKYGEVSVALISDYKFGYKPVTQADANIQLRDYAVKFAGARPVDYVLVAIFAPRLKAPEDFHCALYDAAALAESKAQILSILSGAVNRSAPRKPSYSACEYCRAKATCPEARFIVRSKSLLSLNGMSPAELERAYADWKLVKKIGGAIEDKIKALLKENPEALEGYTLGKPQVMTKVGDASALFERLWEQGLFGLDCAVSRKKFMSQCCKASWPDTVKWVASQTNSTEQAAKSLIKLHAPELVVESEKEASIVEK